MKQKSNMELVHHGKSATRENCNMKEHNMKKVQLDRGATQK